MKSNIVRRIYFSSPVEKSNGSDATPTAKFLPEMLQLLGGRAVDGALHSHSDAKSRGGGPQDGKCDN